VRTGRTVDEHDEIQIGLDVARTRHAVADGGRGIVTTTESGRSQNSGGCLKHVVDSGVGQRDLALYMRSARERHIAIAAELPGDERPGGWSPSLCSPLVLPRPETS
jgi:hypothetical protein